MTKDLRGKSWQRLLLFIGRVTIGATFVYAAYQKLKPQIPGFAWSVGSLRVSLAMFGISIDNYRILPPWTVTLVADVLPFIELVLGLWLIAGLALRFSSLFSVAATFVFLAVQLSAYLRNMKIPCGCDLIPGEVIGPLSLTIDLVLFLACLFLTIGSFRSGRSSAQAGSREFAEQSLA